MAHVFKNEILNKLAPKVTMGRYLAIEREFEINPLKEELAQTLEDQTKKYLKAKEELQKYESILGNKKMNKKEEKRKMDLIQNIVKETDKLNRLYMEQSYNTLELITGEDLDDNEDINFLVLTEFMEYYREKTKALFNPKVKRDDGDEEKK